MSDVYQQNQVDLLRSFSLRFRNNHLTTLPKPCVMGIINMSPNSFYNAIANRDEALFLAEEMVQAGATFLDIGGEATNPSVDITAEQPTIQQEMDRILPLIAAIKERFDVLISVDTSQPQVMRAAVFAGADMVNDQRALRIANAVDVISELNVPVCLMHFFEQKRLPGSCDYKTLLIKIKNDLLQAVQRCELHGISRDRIVLDPGFGQGHYGKNSAENYYLLSHLNELIKMDYPLLIGWSRKSMIGDVLGGVPPTERLFGSIASAAIAGYLGASIVRVHDVKATVDAMKVVAATRQGLFN